MRLVGFYHMLYRVLLIGDDPYDVYFITRNGYASRIANYGELIRRTIRYYTNPSCSGLPTHVAIFDDAYPLPGGGYNTGYSRGDVFVSTINGSSVVYYIPKDAVETVQDLYYLSTNCSLSRNVPAVQPLLNDPVETGITSPIYKTPLKIE